MNTCKYKQICNRYSNRVINCNFPSLCEYQTKYANYNALFSQEAKGISKGRTRLSGFNLEEEVLDMIQLSELNRYAQR